MARSKKKSLWVIFFGPQDFGGSRTKYYDENGKVTKMKNDAVKFYTSEDAKEFADKKKIELSEIIYIGQEDFSESDLIRLESIKQMRNS